MKSDMPSARDRGTDCEEVESRIGAPTSGSDGDSVAFAPGLSPTPIVTFPVPARRTGRAVLPHPALSETSCLRPRQVTGRLRQAHQSQRVVEELVGIAPCGLSPALVLLPQPSTQPMAHVGSRPIPGTATTPWPEPGKAAATATSSPISYSYTASAAPMSSNSSALVRTANWRCKGPSCRSFARIADASSRRELFHGLSCTHV